MVTQVQRYFITSQCQHIFIIFMNHACREIMIYGVLPTTYKRSFSILWNMRLEIKNAFRTSRTGGSNLLGILVFYDVTKYNVIGQACLQIHATLTSLLRNKNMCPNILNKNVKTENTKNLLPSVNICPQVANWDTNWDSSWVFKVNDFCV